MGAVAKVLNIANAEIGYLEKHSNSDLDSKTGNAGINNYTKYARDVYPSLQGQAWCDMFVDWCFVQAFGMVKAKQLLGGFSAYTPTSAQYFKNKGQYHKDKPQPGDQIFFKNATRICHTGIVVRVTDDKVYTIEGNTSNGTSVVINGGAVCEKSYDLDNPRIDGYGRPDWSIVEEEAAYEVGWHKDDFGWWYVDTKSTYYHDCFAIINNHKYFFNPDGYAMKGWQEIDGGWYYFEPRSGHPYECALYSTDENGKQDVGIF